MTFCLGPLLNKRLSLRFGDASTLVDSYRTGPYKARVLKPRSGPNNHRKIYFSLLCAALFCLCPLRKALPYIQYICSIFRHMLFEVLISKDNANNQKILPWMSLAVGWIKIRQ
jgi:hypothetical protein